MQPSPYRRVWVITPNFALIRNITYRADSLVTRFAQHPFPCTSFRHAELERPLHQAGSMGEVRPLPVHCQPSILSHDNQSISVHALTITAREGHWSSVRAHLPGGEPVLGMVGCDMPALRSPGATRCMFAIRV